MIGAYGDTIHLLRGDDACIKLTIFTPTGEFYNFQDGDTATFFLLKKPSKKPTSAPVFKKTFDSEYAVEISPDDTLYLKGGEYFYVIVLTMADGSQETVNYGRFYIDL